MAAGDKIQISIPVGAVYNFPALTIPDGYLECNGAELSRTSYAALFAILGTTYGVGDGETTFNLPDLRGEFVRGYDNGRGVDSGRAIGSSQADATAKNGLSVTINSNGAHTHGYSWTAANTVNATNNYVSMSSNNQGGTKNFTTGSAGSHGHTNSVSGDTETRPRNQAMVYCIKY